MNTHRHLSSEEIFEQLTAGDAPPASIAGCASCEAEASSLSSFLAELKREAFNLRFQAATNQLERPARIKEVRRDIARIKTLQTERTSAAVKA